jgi:hypothetical protein
MFKTGHRRVVAAGVCLFRLGVFCLHAQTNEPAAEPGSTNAPMVTDTNAMACCMDEAPVCRPLSLSGEFGTTGGGGNVSWRFLGHLGLRAGGDYFSYDYSGKIEDVKYNSRVRLLSGTASLDIYPWKKHSFRISLGALINQSELTGSPDPTQNVTIDGVTFTPADVGTLRVKIKPDSVNPYVAMGGTFFYFDHAHHWSLGGEIGVAYTKWDVSLSHSTPPDPTLDQAIANERRKIKKKLNDYPVWPIVKLQVSYAF